MRTIIELNLLYVRINCGCVQVMLQNPVCLVCYAMASWKFFHDRIKEEEKTLVHFFGEQYRQYQRRVGTGLPFITGFTKQTD
jgi:protein-S-isoprenylcysteine O-methyltransferase